MDPLDYHRMFRRVALGCWLLALTAGAGLQFLDALPELVRGGLAVVVFIMVLWGGAAWIAGDPDDA